MTGTFLILLATFFWALDTLIRYPLLEAGLTSIQIVFMEHLLLVVVMSFWLRLRQQPIWAFVARDWLPLLVIGGLGSAIGTLAFTEAFSYMNPTIVILLQKLQPVIAISLAALLLKERLHVGFVLCMVLAFSGSFLLVFDDFKALVASDGWHYSEELTRRMIGYGLALVAVFSWGASTVFGKKLGLSGYSSAQIMNGRFVVGFVVILPFVLLQSNPEAAITLSLGLRIGLMVLISGLLGMILYYQGLSRVESKHSALAEMGFPVMAGIINWVALDFSLSLLQILGGLLLIAASFAVHIKIPVRHSKKPLESATA